MEIKKISMKKLSEKVGIAQPHLTNLLTGKSGFGAKSIMLLNRIANVEVDVMLNGDWSETRRQVEKKFGVITPWIREGKK